MAVLPVAELSPVVARMSYGTRDMVVVDPFSNRLIFTDDGAAD